MSARKHLEEIPNSSGIYQIRCNQNGKIYVGSATSLQARWCVHRRELRRRLHHNPHLQHAWNLHGEASFEFIVNLSDFCRRNRLDFPSMHRLPRGLSKLKSYKGWTHANSVREREFIKTHHGFVDPDGRPAAPIRNLAALKSGKRPSHKGWTWKHDADQAFE